MTKKISSIQNQLIKNLYQLKEKSKHRKNFRKFLIEGQREIELAAKGGYELETILFFRDLLCESQIDNLKATCHELIEISKDVYQKLAHRDTTEGVLAVAKTKSQKLEDLRITSKNPLILVAEAPEKPGNIGAILRTADAASVDAVIIANPKTDLYNPNIIRSSVGCVFTNQIAIGSTEDIIDYLKAQNINIYCASLDGSVNYHTQDYSQPTAIIVGTEASGLSIDWLESSTQNIIIPMQGEIDSMNVSVAAGILIFEVKRQRQFN